MSRWLLLSLFITTSLQAQSTTPLYSLVGNTALDEFGTASACGDFIAPASAGDIVVGAPQTSASSPGYVAFFDGATGTQQFTVVGGSPGDRFGQSVDSVGDLNSDGIPDLVIGSPGGVSQQATVYLSPFSASPANVPLFSALFTSGHDGGYAVLGVLSDFGGGTNSDVAVGAPLYESSSVSSPCSTGTLGFSNCGMVEVFDVSSPFTSASSVARIEGSINGGRLGFSLASVSDLNADGKRDIVAGEPGASTNRGNLVVLYSNITSGVFPAPLRVNGSAAGEQFGYAVANVGDLNGDGFDDVAVGAPFATTIANTEGLVRVYSGATLSPASTTGPQLLCTISGTVAAGNLGSSIAGLGDVTGDGTPDFLVGLPGISASSGQAFIYTFSGGTCSGVLPYSGNLYGDDALGNSFAGKAYSQGQCDVNSDGVPDFGIGSLRDNPSTDIGSLNLFAGVANTPTPTATPTPTPVLNSKLDYRISNSGRLLGTLRYVGTLPGGCNVTLYARRTLSDLSDKGPLRNLIDSVTATDPLKFEVKGLHKVKKPAPGKPFLYHLLAETVCGSTVMRSNVFARKLTCGRDPAVSINQFEKKVTATIAIK